MIVDIYDPQRNVSYDQQDGNDKEKTDPYVLAEGTQGHGDNGRHDKACANASDFNGIYIFTIKENIIKIGVSEAGA